MDPDRVNTVLILRRMTRKMIPRTWGIYNPMMAKPEELRFEILDKYERQLGRLEFNMFDIHLVQPCNASLSTPWGEAKVRHERKRTTVFLNGRVLCNVSMFALKRKVEVDFANGTTLILQRTKRSGLDIRFEDDFGNIGVFVENGTLPPERADPSTQVTKEDIKKLPKKERPTSIESLYYVQYRITAAGTLRVNKDDFVRAICIFYSYLRLISEIPQG